MGATDKGCKNVSEVPFGKMGQRMIDEEATFKEFGYLSSDLKPKSHKKIVVVCEICNKRRTLQMYSHTNSKSYIKNGLSLCIACSKILYQGDNYGENGGFFGKHHMQEAKEKMRIKNRGRAGFWKDKQLSEETRKKISDNHANFSKENHPRWKHRLFKTCECCGEIFEVRQYREHDARFCSRICKISYCRGENSGTWRGGTSFEPYCKLWNEPFKEKIRNEYNRTCFLCGKTEDDNGKKLSVHHVNYGKMCMCDYDCRFVPLCISCHAKTNTNRYHWFSFIMCKLNLEFSAQFVDFMVVA